MPDAKTGITYDAYLTLLGLTALVNEHMAQIGHLKRAVATIVGRDPDDYGDGILDDWLWSLDTRDANDLLRSARLEVASVPDERNTDV